MVDTSKNEWWTARVRLDADQVSQIETHYGIKLGEDDPDLPTSGASSIFTTKDKRGPHLTVSPDFENEGDFSAEGLGMVAITIGWDSPRRDSAARAVAADVTDYLGSIGAEIVEIDPVPKSPGSTD